MIKNIYYEQKVENHDRTQEFFSRFPKAAKISCNHFKEVFNPSGQNFRLQKKNPSLILASQDGKKVHPIPAKYGCGGNQQLLFLSFIQLFIRLPLLFSSRHVPEENNNGNRINN